MHSLFILRNWPNKYFPDVFNFPSSGGQRARGRSKSDSSPMPNANSNWKIKIKKEEEEKMTTCFYSETSTLIDGNGGGCLGYFYPLFFCTYIYKGEKGSLFRSEVG